jgi:PKD repeat protein
LYETEGLDFTSATQWEEFLLAYYSALAGGNNPPAIQSWLPSSNPTINEGESIDFHVGASDLDGNILSYYWAFDSVWMPAETGETCSFSAGYDDQGVHAVSVLVWDGAEYDQHNWTLTITDVPPNTPPVASFSVTPNPGDVYTLFSFDASASFDSETPLSGLEFRWDWDGDGAWDTDWLAEPYITHQFTLPGNYSVRLEIRDQGGATDEFQVSVEVWEIIPEFDAVVVVLGTLCMLAAVTGYVRRTSHRGR